MLIKVCSKCNLEKPTTEYHKHGQVKSGLRPECISCFKEARKIHYLANIDRMREAAKINSKKPENKVRILQYQRNYRKNNSEKRKSLYKNWYEKNRDKSINYSKEYFARNKDRIIKRMNARSRIKRKTDPLYKLKCTLRNRVFLVFKGNKNKRTTEILGASTEIVKKHIERQFKKGMTWGNHGNGVRRWHIDHVIPLASAKTVEDLMSLFHYTNLQPLWGKENLSKGKKIIKPIQVKMPI